MFEVYLTPDASGEGLLTEETLRDTKALVMTDEEAEREGFLDIPEPAVDRGERRLIVVGKTDERRIQNALEANPQVAGFRVQFANR